MENTKKEFTPIATHNLYSISRDGEVYSSIKNKILKPGKNSVGYLQVWLKDNEGNARWERIHVLNALTYVDNPNNYPEVNHVDGDKLNNNDWNLQWCTRAQNQQHAHDTGLMPKTKFRRKGIIISEETRRKMSESKIGANHPKYKGGYTTPAGHFHTAQEAADANGLATRTVLSRCKNPTWIYFGWWAGKKQPYPKERPQRTRSIKWYEANK